MVAGVVPEVVFDVDLLTATVGADGEVVAFPVNDRSAALCAVKTQGVRFFVVVRPVIDGVFAVTPREVVGVGLVVATFHIVIARTANKSVMAFAAVEFVVARAASQVVGAGVAVQFVVVVRANAVSQSVHVLFAQGFGVLGQGAVLGSFRHVLCMLFGKLRQCRVFAVVAFRQQFAEIGEGFAGVFLVDFVKERGNAAVIKAVFAFFVHAQAHGIKIGAQAGLEEQAVVEAIDQFVVSTVGGINNVFGLRFVEIIEF